MIYEGKKGNLMKAFESVLSVMTKYQASCSPNKDIRLRGLKWEPPPFSCYKLNMDRVTFFDMQKTGVVFIVRDHKGQVLLAASIFESIVNENETIEVIVVLRSLQLCLQQGFSNLIIESDCFILMERLNVVQEPHTILDNILLEIKHIMS